MEVIEQLDRAHSLQWWGLKPNKEASGVNQKREVETVHINIPYKKFSGTEFRESQCLLEGDAGSGRVLETEV